jgi:hypothetical protein
MYGENNWHDLAPGLAQGLKAAAYSLPALHRAFDELGGDDARMSRRGRLGRRGAAGRRRTRAADQQMDAERLPIG